MNGVKITVLHNCAVVISYAGESVMVDALTLGRPPFEGINDEHCGMAFNGEGCFENVRAALYTHTHPDHYNQGLNEQYMRRYGVPMFIPDRDLGHTGRFTVGQFYIKYCRMPHSGKEYADVIHYVFLVEAGGRNIYITGDADFNSTDHYAFLGGTRVDVMLSNPFYLSAHADPIKKIGAKNTYIYHIPSDYDTEGIREMAFNSYKHYGISDVVSLIDKHPYIITI